jgi:hypothetical protein
MLPSIRLRIVQLKPPVLQRPRAHRAQNKLRNAPLWRALEPSTTHTHAARGRHRDSRNPLPNLRMTGPRIMVLIDGRGKAPDVELKGRVAFKFAWCILGGRGVDLEVGAAHAGIDVAGHVEGDFSVDGVADFAVELGVLGRVGGIVAEGDKQMGHLCCEEGTQGAETEEGQEVEATHCDEGKAEGWSMFECLLSLQLGGDALYYKAKGKGICQKRAKSKQEEVLPTHDFCVHRDCRRT